MNLRQPLHPVALNALIMITSGVVASVLCAQVYGATLPGGEAEKAPLELAAAAAQQSPSQLNPVLALIGAQRPIAATANDKISQPGR